MKQYLDLARAIRDNGTYKGDRTGTGTLSVFGHQMRFNLQDGFPLVTTKKTHLKSIIHELLWFLKGETNISYLKENGVSIWDDWVKAGSEVYRDMYPAEVQSELVKYLSVTDFTPVASQDLEGTTEYQLLRDEDDSDRIVFEYGSDGSWLRAYEEITGNPAHKLVGGELGPVYGSQWRSWPNPKINLHERIDPTLSATDLFGKVEKLSPNNIVGKWIIDTLNNPKLEHCKIVDTDIITVVRDGAQSLQLTVYANEHRVILAADVPPGVTTVTGFYEYYKQRNTLPPVLVIKYEESPMTNQYAADEKRRYIGSGMTYEQWLSEGRATAFVKHESIDQIANLIEMLKKNPDSRRLIVSAWNPAEVDNMALPPCHALFQFYTVELTENERTKSFDDILGSAKPSRWWNSGSETLEEYLDAMGVPKRKLSCQLYQRSADVALGVPFNIASYALLTMMVAQVVNMVPGDFIWTGGDCHIYSNHMEGIDEQLTRDPLPLPKMTIRKRGQDIDGFVYEDFVLEGYESHPHIFFPIAV